MGLDDQPLLKLKKGLKLIISAALDLLFDKKEKHGDNKKKLEPPLKDDSKV